MLQVFALWVWRTLAKKRGRMKDKCDLTRLKNSEMHHGLDLKCHPLGNVLNTCAVAWGAILWVLGYLEARVWLVDIAPRGGTVEIISASGFIMPFLLSALLHGKTCCRQLPLPWRS